KKNPHIMWGKTGMVLIYTIYNIVLKGFLTVPVHKASMSTKPAKAGFMIFL
ncbi:hypothetical protein SAMN03159364_05035, partial [Klebsiella quasipneumoniae]